GFLYLAAYPFIRFYHFMRYLFSAVYLYRRFSKTSKTNQPLGKICQFFYGCLNVCYFYNYFIACNSCLQLRTFMKVFTRWFAKFPMDALPATERLPKLSVLQKAPEW